MKRRSIKPLVHFAALLCLIAVSCHSQPQNKDPVLLQNNIDTMQLTSGAFKNEEEIPAKYTCSGEDINPPLIISGIPAKAKSLAFILDDPDAPNGTFTHWIMWNIYPQTKNIAENSVPRNAIQGENSAGQNKYFGPCPPSGIHHYHFKIYALDTMLSLPGNAHVEQLEKAM
ncbi:MAG: YbhB/YbcL family Raf kinase inhibitor-like protein, partial [Chitinophagaceae bacterium]